MSIQSHIAHTRNGDAQEGLLIPTMTLLLLRHAIAIRALAAAEHRPSAPLASKLCSILPVLPNLYTFFVFSTARESLDHLQAAVFA